MVGVIVINIVCIICVFWVFFDATSNNIGSYVVRDGVRKGCRRGIHPVVWAALSIFILPFIWYLINRKSLLIAAEEYPVKKFYYSTFVGIRMVALSLQRLFILLSYSQYNEAG